MMEDAHCSFGWVECLHTWQDFAGALLAALIAGSFVMIQIWLGAADARAQKGARYTAARASLSFALIELTSYAEECTKLLVSIHRTARGEAIPRGSTLGPPALPKEAIDRIVELIKAAPPKVAQQAASLLSGIQVLHSRLDGLLADIGPTAPAGRVVVKSNVEEYLIDAAKAYARCSALFPLARFDPTPSTPIAWKDVVSALRIMGVGDDEIPRVFETVTNRAATGRPL